MWNPFEPPTSDGRDGDSPLDLDEEDVPVRPGDGARGALEERIADALTEVVDPELGINIVDLGLVYAIETSDESVRIAVTSTTPACPMADAIRRDVERHAGEVMPADRELEIVQVWEPKWQPAFMSPEAREKLGGLGADDASGGLW